MHRYQQFYTVHTVAGLYTKIRSSISSSKVFYICCFNNCSWKHILKVEGEKMPTNLVKLLYMTFSCTCSNHCR